MTSKDGLVWILQEGPEGIYYGVYDSEKIANAAKSWLQERFPDKHFYYTAEIVEYYWTEQIEKEMEEAYSDERFYLD